MNVREALACQVVLYWTAILWSTVVQGFFHQPAHPGREGVDGKD